MPKNYTAIRGLQKLLFSPLCFGCRKSLGENSAFCFSCRLSLVRQKISGCLFRFDGPVPALFQAWRTRAPYMASAWLFSFLAREGKLEEWRGIDAVFPAPQSRRSGRSGLEILAVQVAAALGAEAVLGELKKQRGRTQHGRDYAGRVDTACFVSLKKRLDGKRVLVLDDVTTTGTTLDLCAYVLRKAGAAEVITFALAEQMGPSLERERKKAKEEGEEVHPLLFHFSV